MKPEEIKNEKLEQELSEEELEGATGGKTLAEVPEEIVVGDPADLKNIKTL